MSNFAFFAQDFAPIAEAAAQAERSMAGDPRAACFHARFALEAMVHWLYRHDTLLRMPYDQNLGALLHDPVFQNLLPQAVFQKARLIQKVGNQAVHNAQAPRPADALRVVKELHHCCHWLARTYAPAARRNAPAWSDDLVPQSSAPGELIPRQELETREKELAERNKALLKSQQERDALDAEIQALRHQLAEARAAAEQRPDDHDYSEAETRRALIDVELARAGWPLEERRNREYRVAMPNTAGRADYVLWGDDNNPLAVVEAKRTTVDPLQGQQQAKLYADGLEATYGIRPLIFCTNGYKTWLWDDRIYPPREVAGFFKKDELSRLALRRTQRHPLDVAQVRSTIVDRYYQKRAIGSIFTQFTAARRKALLVMATGTGKTRTAVALVDVLQRAGWVKRVLFLADRVALVHQAVGAFKKHLPESSPVNLVTERDAEGRVFVCTYPTMMGLIDETEGLQARFSPGHFDLVIIDEAHRSVYQKYGAIFRYFDALLVGLTATPREDVDKNTYDLFELETGVPTDAYELAQAVRDGYLVPPRGEQVDLKFPREGIAYDELSDEEKAQWESLDWGDEDNAVAPPDRVDPAAINRWLFNRDTVDKMLRHLMEHGHKVAGGDRLAKTIVFARNHQHAQFIEARFNHHYPQYAGHFARVIDNTVSHAQSLIDDFSQADKAPHIALSVDMLDTGIDIPEVANLVFFKPVSSKIKFWQMVGRGTRLCPDIFGSGKDKQDFRIFDFCANFDFFREHPDPIATAGDPAPLGTRLFRSRVRLLGYVQGTPALDSDGTLGRALADGLHAEVAAMNREHFAVRLELAAVERFQRREAWEHLTAPDREVLERQVAHLPTTLPLEDEAPRRFDLMALEMQLALVEGDLGLFEGRRRRVVKMAALLEEKVAIPAVAAQRAYLGALQESSFWDGLSIAGIGDMRRRLWALTSFLDRRMRPVIYTDFKDEFQGVRDVETVAIPKMTGAQYEKKVNDFLRDHQDHLVIHRLRTHQPLTPQDLHGLEEILASLGEEDGPGLLSGLLAKSGAPSVAHFVRSLVGMDRATAQGAFSQFLNDRSLTAPQIRFIEMIVDQLTSRGIVGASALYEAPFSSLHAGGPDALFAKKPHVLKELFRTLESLASLPPCATG